MVLAVNLRKELADRKISQSDFARLMGVTPTWAGKLLAGRAKAGTELQKRIDAFLSTCWVCGRKWPASKNNT